MKQKFILIFGGVSTEHDVSLKSFEFLYETIEKTPLFNSLHSVIFISKSGKLYKYDTSFNLSYKHYMNTSKKYEISLLEVLRYTKNNNLFLYSLLYGKFGEDGSIQGVAKVFDIKSNIGSIFSNALSINKYYLNQYFQSRDLPLSPKTILLNKKSDIAKEFKNIRGPVVIKPNCMGSSKFLSKCEQPLKELSEIQNLCNNIYQNDDEVLVQEYIQGIEYTCACTDYEKEIQVLPLVKVKCPYDIYDYHAKYDKNNYYKVIELSDESALETEIKKITKSIYCELNCNGTIRIDYIVKENQIYLIEINTMPGLTSMSSLSLMLKTANIPLETYIRKQVGVQ